LRLLDRAWRTLATHACFAVYIPGSLVLGLPASLLVRAFAPPSRRTQLGKWLLRRWYAFFVGMMQWVGVLDLDAPDRAALAQPGLFVVSNHPTLIDFPMLGSMLSSPECLVKASLLDHWAMGWPVRMAGYIPNDRGDETLELCRRSLAQGNSIVIFPEGTRTPPGQAPRFQRGAAQLALRSVDRLTLVRIDTTTSNLEKDGRWWLAPPEKMRARVTISGELDLKAILEAHGGEAPLAARELTAALERRYTEELARGRA
jgi:1-acyl-sn-glycerol-3-phosphate acyltransferase